MSGTRLFRRVLFSLAFRRIASIRDTAMTIYEQLQPSYDRLAETLRLEYLAARLGHLAVEDSVSLIPPLKDPSNPELGFTLYNPDVAEDGAW